MYICIYVYIKEKVWIIMSMCLYVYKFVYVYERMSVYKYVRLYLRVAPLPDLDPNCIVAPRV